MVVGKVVGGGRTKQKKITVNENALNEKSSPAMCDHPRINAGRGSE